MKIRMQSTLAALVLCATFNLQTMTLRAQGTAFTYQGRLNAGAGPANGSYDLAFTLYDSTNLPGNVIAGPLTNSATGVTNGLFTTTLDFGSGVFTGNARWLEIAVRTNGGGSFATLAPRQQVTPTPYAIMANTASNLLGTLPSAQLSGTYGGPVTFNNGLDNFDGTFFGQFFGSTFTGGSFSGQFLGDGSGLSGLWRTAGNSGTTPGVNFLGTTDNQPLIIKVNGQEAMRYEPTTNAPNVVGGYAGNSDGGALDYGVTIAGGGASGFANTIQGANVTFSTIGGGAANTISGNNAFHSTIGGGIYNTISGNNAFESVIAGGGQNTNQGSQSSIGGGLLNVIQDNTPYSVIAGGIQNTIQSNNYASYIGAGNNNTIQQGAGGSIIGGGNNSVIETNADHSIIVGGWQNAIEYGAYESAISGGEYNDLGPFAQWTFIGEGINNTNDSSYAFIGGGYDNFIQYNNWGAFIGAGAHNTIQSGSGYSAIPSGYGNVVQSNSSYTVIGGGGNNVLFGLADYSVIAGGYANNMQGDALYTTDGFPYASTIGGGYNNSIQTNSDWSYIGGGYFNSIQPYSTGSTIGGGFFNLIQGDSNRWAGIILMSATIAGGADNNIQSGSGYATIGGGVGNVIGTNSSFSTIAGGNGNTIQVNSPDSIIGGGSGNNIYPNNFYSSIFGGENNVIHTNANFSFIGGGVGNNIQDFTALSVIGGGSANTVTEGQPYNFIGGGVSNSAGAFGYNFVGGGVFNRASGYGAVVPGGISNTASGSGSFAAGSYAQALQPGTFVWADSQPVPFASTVSNQFAVRAGGGIWFNTGGAGMTLDGQVVLSGTVSAGQLSGNYTNTVTMTNAGNVFAGNGTGLTNVNAALFNGLPSTAFAPASGSTSYIQNQPGPAQNASFDISGNGTVNGTVTTTTLVVSNIIADGPITAPTVTANGLTGGNVSATTLAAVNSLMVTNNATVGGVVGANALSLTNALRVPNAGLNTTGAAFIQWAAATNTSSDNTVIVNPLCDGDPNAILLVTHNYNPGNTLSFAVYNHVVGVYYNGARWAVYNEDLSNMPTNIAFNVLVIKR